MLKYFLCRIVTVGLHWWKHYPGEKAYVRCRICGKYPKSMWDTLRRIKKIKKDCRLTWIGKKCINISYKRSKK
jgi:hypothetical protein